MNTRCILLIEDNPDDRELTIRALEKACPGIKVLCVEDGASAFEILRGLTKPASLGTKESIGLVLLDLKMPRVDGLDLLRRLKALPATIRPLPIVVLSSSSERRDMEAAYELGVNSYLIKPVAFERFLEVMSLTVRYWLEVNELPA